MSDNENTKPTTEVQGDDKKKARKTTKVDSYATYRFLCYLHLQGFEAGTPQARNLEERNGCDEFLRFRYFRENCDGGWPSGSCQSQEHCGYSRDSDRCSSDSSWRVGEACYFRGNEGCE